MITEDDKHSTKNDITEQNTITSSLEIIFIEETDNSVHYDCGGSNSEGSARDAVEIEVLG